MDHRMRASDADREALRPPGWRDHYAERERPHAGRAGRAGLGGTDAKTFGELRSLTDLPCGRRLSPRTAARPSWGGPPPWRRHYHRRPPMPLILLIALLVVLSSGGGWAVFGFFRLILVFWLAMMLTRIAIGLVHRRRHRYR